MSDDAKGQADQPKSDQNQDQDKGGAKIVSDPNQSVPPHMLKGILEHHTKTLRSELSSMVNETRQDVASKIAELMERLDARQTKDKSEDGKPSKSAPDGGELLELRKRLEQAEKNLQVERERREEAERRSQESEFKRRVIDSLTRAGCISPEYAFRAIREDLDHDRETGEISAEYEDPEYGQTLRLKLDEYVQQVVREKALPQLFRAASKPGASVGGSEGKPKYEITRDQWMDPEFYAKNRDRIVELAKQGKVEPPPGKDRFMP